jgi:hypothetical protein
MTRIEIDGIVNEILKFERDNAGYDVSGLVDNFDKGYLISLVVTLSTIYPDIVDYIKNRYETLAFMSDNK